MVVRYSVFITFCDCDRFAILGQRPRHFWNDFFVVPPTKRMWYLRIGNFGTVCVCSVLKSRFHTLKFHCHLLAYRSFFIVLSFAQLPCTGTPCNVPPNGVINIDHCRVAFTCHFLFLLCARSQSIRLTIAVITLRWMPVNIRPSHQRARCVYVISNVKPFSFSIEHWWSEWNAVSSCFRVPNANEFL